VAVPVAAEALAGTSLAPLKVALKVTLGSGTGAGSLLLQDDTLVTIKAIAKNLINSFIIIILKIKKDGGVLLIPAD
jgi:hypothetical protein